MNEKLARHIEAMKRLHPTTKFTVVDESPVTNVTPDKPTGITGKERKADDAMALIRRQFGLAD